MSFPVGARTTGEFITASIWNADLKDNLNTLRAGGVAIASQAALDFLYASSASQLARLAAVAGKAPRLNAAGAAWEMVTLAGELLKAGSGTSTNTSAENLDTYAMASGLTAKDTLHLFICLGATTQACGTPLLYNSTDSVSLGNISALAAADTWLGHAIIRQRQTAATAVLSAIIGLETTGGGIAGTKTDATFTTAWTAAWTLALRSSGVTSGGTLDWSWALFLLRGQ